MTDLDPIVERARMAFMAALTPAELENAKAQFLGKSGQMTELMKGMATLDVEQKKSRGAAINLAKQAIESALFEKRQALAGAELEMQLKSGIGRQSAGSSAHRRGATSCVPNA